MTFLGHVTEPEAISADPQSIATLLSYPVPKNQKTTEAVPRYMWVSS
jgi:hypothetical protein